MVSNIFFWKKKPILKTTGWFNYQVVGRWLEVVFFLHAPDTLNREKWLPPLLKASVPQLQDEKVKEGFCELFGGHAMQRMYIYVNMYIYIYWHLHRCVYMCIGFWYVYFLYFHIRYQHYAYMYICNMPKWLHETDCVKVWPSSLCTWKFTRKWHTARDSTRIFLKAFSGFANYHLLTCLSWGKIWSKHLTST